MSDTIKENGEQTQTDEPHKDRLFEFVIKTCIVGIVISACTIFTAGWIIGSIEDSIHDLRIGGPQFWTKIERELDRAADPSSDLPPERKQKLINDVRMIVARWRPFIDAAQNGIQKPPNAN